MLLSTGEAFQLSCDLHLKNASGSTLLEVAEYAQQEKLSSVVQTLENCTGDLLLAAVDDGSIECIQMILKAGGNINFTKSVLPSEKNVHLLNFIIEQTKCTTMGIDAFNRGLMWNTYEFLSEIDKLNSLTKCESCKVLLGSSVTEQNRDYMFRETVYTHFVRAETSPLLCAIENDNLTVAEYLLDNGAKLHIDLGRSAEHSIFHANVLCIAVCMDKPDFLRLFLKYCPNINTLITKKVTEIASEVCLMILLRAGLCRSNFITPHERLGLLAGKYGAQIPYQIQETKPYSLMQFACQCVRQTIYESSDLNLIAAITSLRLPSAIERYVLCDYEYVK